MPTEICRHIRANGTRCGSPALRGRALCFFHHSDRLRYPNRRHQTVDDTPAVIHPMLPGPGGMQRDPLLAEYFSAPSLLALDIPPLEDRESIQVALSMLLAALARNQLDPKRAGLLLYGLQVASANAKTLTQNSLETVRDTVLDDTGLEIAPDRDPEEPIEEPSFMESMLAELKAGERLRLRCRQHRDRARNSPQINTLPDPTPYPLRRQDFAAPGEGTYPTAPAAAPAPPESDTPNPR